MISFPIDMPPVVAQSGDAVLPRQMLLTRCLRSCCKHREHHHHTCNKRLHQMIRCGDPCWKEMNLLSPLVASKEYGVLLAVEYSIDDRQLCCRIPATPSTVSVSNLEMHCFMMRIVTVCLWLNASLSNTSGAIVRRLAPSKLACKRIHVQRVFVHT